MAAQARVGNHGDAAATLDAAAIDAFDVADCLRWSTPATPRGSAAAYVVSTGGDGGFPGAVGETSDGRPVAVLLSTGLLPWSDLGLPGTPPPEEVADEP
ncbi:hypothetical protein GCM10025868_09840 [Angustibacter aerolatus]|uniref:DUF4241 domain-containing protein n=1 Tax=Angustibacter aerolatus TaxID=1162965 RepID=A0ABQ6JE89_9ACTN|nr:hypothetical protein GCM10025868_09840 [Angustibacter aerolatus]